MHILVIGQGKIGVQVSNLLAERGYEVTGLARRERHHYPLAAKANFIQADAKQLTADDIQPFSHMLIIVSPSTNHGNQEPGKKTEQKHPAEHYHNSYLAIAQHIASLQPQIEQTGQLQRLVFISSTGVYGQHKGEWIDDTTLPTTPQRVTSQLLLQAEDCLKHAFAHTVIIRPSGIYGTQRLMRIRQATAENKTAMPANAWTNRIMDSDLVNIIANVITTKHPKPLYLASDYQPVTSYELLYWLAKQLGSELPTISVEKAAGEAENTENALVTEDGGREVAEFNGNASGKRIHSNIPASWLTYPDWQAGYRLILQSLLSSRQK